MKHSRRTSARLLVAGVVVGIFLPAVAGFPGTDAYIPAVARAQGAQNANFLSTLWITNLTNSIAQVEVRFHETGISNTSPLRFYDTLGPNETKKYDNVVETRFARTGTSGALRILSDREVYSSSRTYDLAEGGSIRDSKGLFFAAVPASFAIASGETATLQGVSQGGPEDMRYNFGLLETAGQAVTVEIGLVDGSGVQTAVKRYTLPAYGRVQYGVSDIQSAVSTTNASLVARIVSGTGRVLFYGTQIANGSNDSSGFEMSFKSSLLGGGGAAGVASLNGLTGNPNIKPGNGNVSVSTSGSDILISATGSGTAESLIPGGAVLAFNLDSCPAGWGPLDGSAGRPDARGRAIIGAGHGPGLSYRDRGATVGNETYVLQIGNLPAHSHRMGGFWSSSAAGVQSFQLDGGQGSLATGAKTTDEITGYRPEDLSQPFSLMQPSIVLLYCQKE